MNSSMIKDDSLFIPLDVEQRLLFLQEIFFVISGALHIPALCCLFTETPPHQAQIKPILVILQITVIIFDIYESILFEPILIAEAAAFYCKGFVCRILDPIKALALLMLGVEAIGIMNIACIIVRHQTILPAIHRLRIKKNASYVIFFVILTLIFGIPVPAFMAFSISEMEMDRLINESNFDIDWIRDRGIFFKFPDTVIFQAIVFTAIMCLLVYMVIVLIPFWHMFHVLSQSNGSARTKITIRQSLFRLFLQLIVPFLFITAPLTMICLQYLTRCFPFMIGVCTLFIIPLHPIVHNIVLLFLMPTYRRVITKPFRRCSKRSQVQVHKNSNLTSRKVTI